MSIFRKAYHTFFFCGSTLWYKLCIQGGHGEYTASPGTGMRLAGIDNAYPHWPGMYKIYTEWGHTLQNDVYHFYILGV